MRHEILRAIVMYEYHAEWSLHNWVENSQNMDEKREMMDIRSTAFMQPSFSGLFVICAYLPNTTFPPAVTIPSSETLTSTMVPLVSTPSWVYIGD